MLKHRSLVMIFSDLLADPAPVIQALHRLRHGGHDVILFHILDEAEVKFPFDGMIEFDEPETQQKLQVDASSFRGDYLAEVQKFCDMYRREYSGRHRLRGHRYQYAVRQSADRLFGESAHAEVNAVVSWNALRCRAWFAVCS